MQCMNSRYQSHYPVDSGYAIILDAGHAITAVYSKQGIHTSQKWKALLAGMYEACSLQPWTFFPFHLHTGKWC